MLPIPHKSVTLTRVMDACQRYDNTLDNPGICRACGADADGVEPDAKGYECENCGAHEVYGAQELLIMGSYHTDGGA